jgi:hypothetical protein
MDNTDNYKGVNEKVDKYVKELSDLTFQTKEARKDIIRLERENRNLKEQNKTATDKVRRFENMTTPSRAQYEAWLEKLGLNDFAQISDKLDSVLKTVINSSENSSETQKAVIEFIENSSNISEYNQSICDITVNKLGSLNDNLISNNKKIYNANFIKAKSFWKIQVWQKWLFYTFIGSLTILLLELIRQIKPFPIIWQKLGLIGGV